MVKTILNPIQLTFSAAERRDGRERRRVVGALLAKHDVVAARVHSELGQVAVGYDHLQHTRIQVNDGFSILIS